MTTSASLGTLPNGFVIGNRVYPNSGLFVKRTFLTSGTTFTTNALTNMVRIRGVGGGGGGGRVSIGSGSNAGSGAGAGGYCEKLVAVNPSTAYSYVIGAAGTAPVGGASTAGGDSTFTITGTTYTAKGGQPGTGDASGGASTTTSSVNAGGAGGVVGTNGDVNASGMAGDSGMVVLGSSGIGASGNGGSGPFGSGGVGLANATSVGNAATGNGSGGGGGMVSNTASTGAGGVGTAGCWLVEEYQ